MLKTQRGVTLVALVITIIVLLILAGVTISLVLNGGIVNQASNATAATAKADVRERVQLAVAEARMVELTPTSGTPENFHAAVIRILGENDATGTPTSTSTGGTATFSIGNNTYTASWTYTANNSIDGEISVTP